MQDEMNTPVETAAEEATAPETVEAAEVGDDAAPAESK